MKLTKRVVDAAKCPDGDAKINVWDGQIPGLALRVYASGRKSYVMKLAIRGRQKWVTLGEHGEVVYDAATDSTLPLTPTNARKIAAHWRALARAGIDPTERQQRQRDGQATINELADAFLESIATAKKATQKAYREQHVRETFGRMRPDAITVDDVRRWHRSMSETPSMANRALDRLSALLNEAEYKGLIERGIRRREVRRFPEKPRERFLSASELARVGAALEALAGAHGGISLDAADAIRLLLFTGCRVGEVLGLRWRDIDLERRVANLADAKAGPRPVLLPVAAVEVLRGLKRRHPDSTWVVPGQKPGSRLTTLQRPWCRVAEAAKLDDVRLHDLRHTVGAWGASGGASLLVVGKLLGHRNAATTQLYAHLADDPVREASERIGAEIADALASRSESDADEDVIVQ